ncbi:cardiolipin synthase [Philodulcilactobacillus myokoensis]|uniref:Cardiolipin synthase n=1 Tax=Philodulcilactobacillus myokoensis TaxID=2929573 RepID=A0A9W6AZC0_9LACO|nr:cardiolipin synthase [Philodulcilactobacillus myokoensis]GLB46076.1 cardiolipin synthase [Philodulcilactobacillus myokoensis]
MLIFLEIILLIIFANTFFALITVFRTKRDIAATWAWLLVLVFIPIFGFLAYSFIGRKLTKKNMFKLQSQDQMQLDSILRKQRRQLKRLNTMGADQIVYNSRSMVEMFMNTDLSFLARHNHVKIYTDGNDLFDQMLADFDQAKNSINVEFYTFYNDQIGNQVLNKLVEKAKKGVHVRVIYDPFGSIGTTRRFFKPLTDAGGRAEPFLRTNFLDFRLNFRDHRKIVVVDGKVAYIGGFNIGDQYLGRKKKFGPWHDTHLRIIGSGIFGLQARFILDWNVTDSKHQITGLDNIIRYFPLNNIDGPTNMQIVSSGPDTDLRQIEMGYIKLIHMAQKSCWIETPYLIPDDSTYDSLRIAAMSGIDVRVIIPHMPDHPFVYRATQYFAHQLAKEGVKIYYYQKGFVHSKTIVVDGEISSVGSANFDYRSFKLNFEVNAFLYDSTVSRKLKRIFLDDIRNSTRQTPKMFDQQSRWLLFKQSFCRLLAPIL